jgi:hypothetical protein
MRAILLRASSLVVVLGSFLVGGGCHSLTCLLPDGRHRSDIVDATLKRRHYSPHSHKQADPVMELARDLTKAEDDLRRDGTITVKTPDVWGDGNLIYFLQEFDRELAARTKTFNETLQAYVARSDVAELRSTTGLATALAAPGTTTTTPQPPAAATPEVIDIPTIDTAGVITKFKAAVAPVQTGIGVEPTELARQHATYIDVCQALRRRHMGDDNTRRAGYGLYKFRVPVSVLPGRETGEGFAAVATLRAQLQVDEANLRYTYPKLVVADLVDTLTPLIMNDWGKKVEPATTSRIDIKSATVTPVSPVAAHADDIFSSESIAKLRVVAQDTIPVELGNSAAPKVQEVRSFLFRYLSQVHEVLDRNYLYSYAARNEIAEASKAVANGHYKVIADHRTKWISAASTASLDETFQKVGWLLALQSGILDVNLKKILDELRTEGKLSEQDAAVVCDEGLSFFDRHEPTYAQARVQLWQRIVREEFPLHVFTLDSQVEEQNVYDAFSSRREMQLALAYNVASGKCNLSQKLAYSRQLALDQADIALNRTVVGFSHGEDTFGWYFYPRVQTPPTESTNIGAFVRMLWSTGPTDHYALKHRKLEPGIRECEVLIAMPSFVADVSFDVTTNWERLTRPGVTKRSYEEMVAQAGRIHRMKCALGGNYDSNCYRPGDVERLFSRVDQLEQMLGMQTHVVNVPYECEQSGTDLFDLGNAQLRPALTGFYGLEYLQPKEGTTGLVAHMFVTGKNFHPTLTHGIVGGSESDTLGTGVGSMAEVEVINRELIRVRVGSLNKALSRKEAFQVRVGTPAGMSNPLFIPPNAPAAPAEKPKGWSFANAPQLAGTLCDEIGLAERFTFITPVPRTITIEHDIAGPLPDRMSGRFIGELSAEKKDGTAILFGANAKSLPLTPLALTLVPGNYAHDPASMTWTIDGRALETEIRATITQFVVTSLSEEFTVTLSGYLTFDKYPVNKMLNAIKITVTPKPCCKTAPAAPRSVGTDLLLPPVAATPENVPPANAGAPAPTFAPQLPQPGSDSPIIELPQPSGAPQPQPQPTPIPIVAPNATT